MEDILDELDIEHSLEIPADADTVEKDSGTMGGNKLICGKYENVEELAKAYENLQSEYTRKCQALSNLQKSEIDSANVEKEVITNTSIVGLSDKDRENVIREYLISLKRQPVAPVVISGKNDFVNIAKPSNRTLRDAEELAEEFFKSKVI